MPCAGQCPMPCAGQCPARACAGQCPMPCAGQCPMPCAGQCPMPCAGLRGPMPNARGPYALCPWAQCPMPYALRGPMPYARGPHAQCPWAQCPWTLCLMPDSTSCYARKAIHLSRYKRLVSPTIIAVAALHRFRLICKPKSLQQKLPPALPMFQIFYHFLSGGKI